jgi:hypothetical protein
VKWLACGHVNRVLAKFCEECGVTLTRASPPQPRAVAATLRMQRSLAQYAQEVMQRHGTQGRFRVGLNTGPVVVGTVTDDLQMDFTAIGDTVNPAARMQQLAEPGSVFLSEFTQRTADEHFDCHPQGELAVKGKAQPTRAWLVVRQRPVRTRLEVAAERAYSQALSVIDAVATGLTDNKLRETFLHSHRSKLIRRAGASGRGTAG